MSTDAGGRPTRVGVRRELFLAYGIAAVALVVVALGAVVASRSVARAAALSDAERSTVRLANLVVGPLLTEVLAGNRLRADELDRGLDNRMSDGYLTEVTVWAADGEVIYSDDLTQIGRREPPPEEVTKAIEQRKSSSAFEEEPEVSGRWAGTDNEGFVEVYVPFEMAGQPLMAFEAYYDYRRVQETARSLMWNLIPLVLLPLLALQFIQIPIALSLAKRVRRHETDRATLLEQTLSLSEKERIRIAADLHDGPIQDMAGVGYALGAIGPSVAPERQPLMAEVESTVQHAITSLRRLMVDLYPPDLNAGRLPDTLANLVVPLRERGLEVETDIEALPELSNDVVTTLYRVARESLANVAEHAEAQKVVLTLEVLADPARPAARSVELTIADDGIGVDPDHLDRRAEGHLGLRLLRDRVEDLGGSMTISPAQGGGTVVKAVLPLTEDLAGQLV